MNFETYEKTGQSEYAALSEVVAALLSAAIARRDDVRLEHTQRRAKTPASPKKKLVRDGVLESLEIEAAAKDLAGRRDSSFSSITSRSTRAMISLRSVLERGASARTARSLSLS